jgi:hypothetical protein
VKLVTNRQLDSERLKLGGEAKVCSEAKVMVKLTLALKLRLR